MPRASLSASNAGNGQQVAVKILSPPFGFGTAARPDVLSRAPGRHPRHSSPPKRSRGWRGITRRHCGSGPSRGRAHDVDWKWAGAPWVAKSFARLVPRLGNRDSSTALQQTRLGDHDPRSWPLEAALKVYARMRAGVCTRLPKNNYVVCGLHSAVQYGRTWAERGREGDY